MANQPYVHGATAHVIKQDTECEIIPFPQVDKRGAARHPQYQRRNKICPQNGSLATNQHARHRAHRGQDATRHSTWKNDMRIIRTFWNTAAQELATSAAHLAGEIVDALRHDDSRCSCKPDLSDRERRIIIAAGCAYGAIMSACSIIPCLI